MNSYLAFCLGFLTCVVTLTIYRIFMKRGSVRPNMVRPNHMKPIYSGYKGGWANVNLCIECNTIGLYEDMHEVNPCHRCAGKVVRYGAGKWVEIEGEWCWMIKKENRN